MNGDEEAWQFWLVLQLDEPLTNTIPGRFCVGLPRRWRFRPHSDDSGIVIGPLLRAAKFESRGARVGPSLRKSGELGFQQQIRMTHRALA